MNFLKFILKKIASSRSCPLKYSDFYVKMPFSFPTLEENWRFGVGHNYPASLGTADWHSLRWVEVGLQKYKNSLQKLLMMSSNAVINTKKKI